ncbi:adenosylhomocysteinase [Halorhodospira halophila]|uniref:Adenosylhomocysteinase n=1 Tax=Halorhodospira halophila (strain DSM 244 / SL1) TaxID=349124 RepID=A1WT33_HALHL|nr:adenosylhomocysteinase [Halorhodospira halophila]ABM60845.1 adenosylhomocysteinase [Halorhodospira halophila SL1]MBK1728499.1 adenosylhomocysteinase [Halorhodospira halophila]
MTTTSSAEPGHQKLAWARAHMPVHTALRDRYREIRPFAGLCIAVCSHIEAKTGVFLETLAAAGAEVVFTGSEPGSSQDDVVAALNEQPGISGYARRGVNEEELARLHSRALDHQPNLILDDAAELTARLVHQRPELLDGLRGVCEQTTTGVQRIQAMLADGALRFPAYAVNHTPMKHEFDNIHGTGESALTNLMLTTNLLLAGKQVVVCGYGDCGVGIAHKARAWGAQVTVTEVEPRRALRAHMNGFAVRPMDEAAGIGEFFITATGNRDVIRGEHFRLMRDGAILANAGHFNVEIDAAGLADEAEARYTVRPGIEAFRMGDGREIHLICEGRLVNLAAPTAMGHPAEVMDQTFAMQFMAAEDLLRRRDQLNAGVHAVPDAVDAEVASLKLKTLGVGIDALTDSQRRFLEAWRADDILESP